MTDNPYRPPTAALDTPWSQVDDAAPPNVVTAARLLLTSIGLTIASIGATTAGWMDLPGGNAYSVGELAFHGFDIALTIFLIRKLYDRRNWARWFLALSCGIGIAMTTWSVIVAFEFWQSTSLALRGVGIAQYTLALTTVIFLFSPQANVWFRYGGDA